MLDQGYTIFGVVTGGLEVAQKIAQGDRIHSVEILDQADAVFADQKGRLAQWNSILDKKFGRRLSPAPQTS
jgi:cyclophilin family peptidyl-prolyl cis-trans isomerase